MTVISTTKDPENLMLTLVAEFDATPERVWSVWEDPRKLEQWWGPPAWRPSARLLTPPRTSRQPRPSSASAPADT